MLAQFCIKLEPRTKKNSQRIVCRGNQRFIMPSAQYMEYEKDCAWFIPNIKTIDEPVTIKAHFYMKTRRKCDLTNLLEAIDDILVKYNVIADDNYTIVASHDGSRVYYDKDNPRTEIYIERYVENE